MAQLLDQQDAVIAGIYAARSAKGADHFRGLMDAETWMTAERAVEEGLADEVLVPSDAPKDRAPTLSQKIASAAVSVEDVVSGVERLVAAHAGADSPLTGAKREGLVALRAAAERIDGLLSDGSPVEDAFALERLAAAKRMNDFQAALPPRFLG